MGSTIKWALLGLIGLVVWYGVFLGINTDLWDSAVVSILTVVPIVVIAAVILAVLGIRLGSK